MLRLFPLLTITLASCANAASDRSARKEAAPTPTAAPSEAASAAPAVPSAAGVPAPEPTTSAASSAEALGLDPNPSATDAELDAKATAIAKQLAEGPTLSRILSADGSGSSAENSNAAVLKGLSKGFQRCYQEGLQKDPKLSGKVVLEAKLGAKGEVTSVSTPNSKMPVSVNECLKEKLAKAPAMITKSLST